MGVYLSVNDVSASKSFAPSVTFRGNNRETRFSDYKSGSYLLVVPFMAVWEPD